MCLHYIWNKIIIWKKIYKPPNSLETQWNTSFSHPKKQHGRPPYGDHFEQLLRSMQRIFQHHGGRLCHVGTLGAQVGDCRLDRNTMPWMMYVCVCKCMCIYILYQSWCNYVYIYMYMGPAVAIDRYKIVYYSVHSVPDKLSVVARVQLPSSNSYSHNEPWLPSTKLGRHLMQRMEDNCPFSSASTRHGRLKTFHAYHGRTPPYHLERNTSRTNGLSPHDSSTTR